MHRRVGADVKRLLMTGLLLLPAPARADCVAFLIPPVASVALDENGLGTWGKDRTDYVLAYPVATLFHKGPTVVIKGGFLTPPVFAACGREDMKVSRKKLLELRTAKGNDFSTVWAEPQELIEVPYALPDGGGYDPRRAIENRHAIERAATLVLDRVESAAFKPPRIVSERTFPADFDRTWAATMEALSDERWQIDTSDKGSGLVTTKASVEEGSSTMACATKPDQAHRTTLNVLVKRLDAGTLVRVDATFGALLEDEIIACTSNGTLEKALFAAIGKRLAVP
jgi:hypothetical protein